MRGCFPSSQEHKNGLDYPLFPDSHFLKDLNLHRTEGFAVTASLTYSKSSIILTTLELGLTRDKYTKKQLAVLIRSRLSWSKPSSISISRPLQDLVDDYSERIATGAPTSIESYFKKIPMGTTVGGRAATSVILHYLRDRLHPGSTDIGALGEGIAGFYLENVGALALIARPFDVSPDMVFLDPVKRKNIVIVQVKATLDKYSRFPITEAIKLLDVLVKCELIKKGKYTARIVYVIIIAKDMFEVFDLELKVV
jgi:hypothetical protein